MRLADRERKLIPGERLSLGFDGSYARDATVLTACTMDVLHIFLIKAWEKADTNRDPDWTVPRSEVDAMVDQMMQTYDATLFADPPGWSSEIEELDAPLRQARGGVQHRHH